MPEMLGHLLVQRGPPVVSFMDGGSGTGAIHASGVPDLLWRDGSYFAAASGLVRKLGSWGGAVVVVGAGCVDVGHVGVGPGFELGEHPDQRQAQFGEFVVDFKRHRRGDGPRNESVAFEVAQGLGEHFLADTADPPGQVGVPYKAP